jgi:translation elongation factor EF-1alpha
LEKRVLDRLEKDCEAAGKGSFKYAWILDRLRHERERGISIETSSWNIETAKFEVDILDAPGHRDFIKVHHSFSPSEGFLISVCLEHGNWSIVSRRSGVNDFSIQGRV